MCPVCMTTVAIVATGGASVGGLTALVAKALRARANRHRNRTLAQAKFREN